MCFLNSYLTRSTPSAPNDDGRASSECCREGLSFIRVGNAWYIPLQLSMRTCLERCHCFRRWLWFICKQDTNHDPGLRLVHPWDEKLGLVNSDGNGGFILAPNLVLELILQCTRSSTKSNALSLRNDAIISVKYSHYFDDHIPLEW